jgi:hypothetical protein
MQNSILTSTKKVLGLAEDYTAFDEDIVQFINGALSTAEQAGAGLSTVFSIEDATTEWDSLGIDPRNLQMLKNYVYLKARLLFDPPATSFALDAMKQQIQELEWRMNVREDNLHPYVP